MLGQLIISSVPLLVADFRRISSTCFLQWCKNTQVKVENVDNFSKRTPIIKQSILKQTEHFPQIEKQIFSKIFYTGVKIHLSRKKLVEKYTCVKFTCVKIHQCKNTPGICSRNSPYTRVFKIISISFIYLLLFTSVCRQIMGQIWVASYCGIQILRLIDYS